ncbi:MAG: MFS transporter [Gammaproteobacteria bacterium]|nr:MFS transporter [Gammaproteobacteria bacterium]
MAETSTTYTAEQRRATLGALLIVFLLGALDQTIVSTAMPRIVEQLKGLHLYAWVTTSYMLASTVTVPIYGKLGDQFGRKPILLTGIVIFLLGSVLCGVAGEFGSLPVLGGGMSQLVVFRGLQGIGGGALFTIAFATIADMYSPRERSRFMGMFGAIFGLASIVGPFVGGFLTDFGDMTLLGYDIAGWRLVFYVNLPLGFLSILILVRRMPFMPGTGSPHVDYVGAALIIATFVPLLLALSWGGHEFAWDSPQIIGLFVGATIALAVLLKVETMVAEPIIPLTLFQNKVVSSVNVAGFLVGMSFFGVVMFMPLFMQVVQGISATNSGLAMFPLMAGMMTGSISAGNIVARGGRYKRILIGGVLILATGALFLSHVGPDTPIWIIAICLALVGLGLGPSQSINNIAVQNAVPPTQIGIATSATQFFRQIGSTVGVAVFGTMLTANLTAELPRQLPVLPGLDVAALDLAELQGLARTGHLVEGGFAQPIENRVTEFDLALQGNATRRTALLSDAAIPDAVKSALDNGSPITGNEAAGLRQLVRDQATQSVERGLKNAFSISITRLFLASFVIVVLTFIATLFIPEIPLRQTAHRAPQRVEPETGATKPPGH